MKHNQAWGWLVAAVVAAGLNSSYHNGDLQWMHRAAEQAKHRTLGVLALATGRADQFLIQSEILAAHEQADSRLAVATSPVEIESTISDASAGEWDALNACKELQKARIEARQTRLHDRMEAEQERLRDRAEADQERIQARMEAEQARLAARAESVQMVQSQLNRALKELPASFSPVMKSFNPMVKMVACPRMRISIPQIPGPEIPAVRIDTAAAGPV